jgi:hypothetical protein
MSIATHYSHEIISRCSRGTLITYGVVATSPGAMGWSGWDAFIDEAMVGGQPDRSPREPEGPPRVNRRGLGRQLAEWRMEASTIRGRGHHRDDDEGTNTASLATARAGRHSSSGLCGSSSPERRSDHRRPRRRIQATRPGDVEAVLDGVNAYYDAYDLFPGRTRPGCSPPQPRPRWVNRSPLPRRGRRRWRDRRRSDRPNSSSS